MANSLLSHLSYIPAETVSVVHTVQLLYQGWLVLDTEEESEVVQEMLDIMQAVGDLLYRRM